MRVVKRWQRAAVLLVLVGGSAVASWSAVLETVECCVTECGGCPIRYCKVTPANPVPIFVVPMLRVAHLAAPAPTFRPSLSPAFVHGGSFLPNEFAPPMRN